MTETITGTSTLGLDLTATTTVIDGTINTTIAPAIYGGTAQSWTVINNGLLNGLEGIFIPGGSNITNAAHATITGTYSGIAAEQPATIQNAGTILGTGIYSDGIFLYAGGIITNSAGGFIAGELGIASPEHGVPLTLLNQGIIAGVSTYAPAIYAATATITNAKGATIIGASGVNLYTGLIANAGLIATTGMYGTAINVRGGATIANTAHATISGGNAGLFAAQAATIGNAGTIAGTAAFSEGILLISGGVITNSAGGLISGNVGIDNAENGGILTLLNQGTIAGTGAYSSGVFAEGTITNAKTGTIIGNTGIQVKGGTITNAGLIEATGPANAAVYLYDGTLINAGKIIAAGTAYAAISLLGSADNELILQKGGAIVGTIGNFIAGDIIDEAGITITTETFTNGVLTLFDRTTKITALTLSGGLNTSAFVLQSDVHGGTDILLGSATFTGTYTNGLRLSALTNTVASSARVTGMYSAIYTGASRNFTLVNDGTIIASGGNYSSAVQFASVGEITNAGLIEGGTGIYFRGGAISNAGTIIGTGGIAITLQRNSATTSITLNAGGRLAGAISGFEAGDTIDLAGVTATGRIFANGVLTLTNAGAVVETIALDGFVNAAAFNLGTAQGGGTDLTIAPTETFSGHYHTGLILSSLFTSITSKASFSYLDALYGRDWTVVNAGTISAANNGVFLVAGQVTNASTGIIRGSTGAYVEGFSAAGLSNAGTIIGTASFGAAVSANFGAEITNLKSGAITGGDLGISLQDSSALSNTGHVTGIIGAGVYQGSTLQNEGVITGKGGSTRSTVNDTGIILSGGSVFNGATGTIAGPTGAKVFAQSFLYNAGRIEGLPGGQNGTVSVASTALYIQYGAVTNAAHAVISGATGVSLAAGTLTDAGIIATSLTTGGIALSFGTAAATLILDTGNFIKGAIAGFNSNDIIDFAATTITADSFSNHVLTLKNGTKAVESLTLSGIYTQNEFTLISEGALGTELILGNAASSMQFLRPPLWAPSLPPESLAPPPSPSATPTPRLAAAPTLTGWLTLDPTPRQPIPAITLHPG